MTYWLRLTDDKMKDGPNNRYIELPFDWLWNLPFVAWTLWKSWRGLYGRV